MKILLLLSWQCKGKKGSENSYFGRKKKRKGKVERKSKDEAKGMRK